MRGAEYQRADMFSHLSPEQGVRNDHPLQAVRAMSDEIQGLWRRTIPLAMFQ